MGIYITFLLNQKTNKNPIFLLVQYHMASKAAQISSNQLN